MMRLPRILFIAHALGACAAMLSGCGQKGPLELPRTPESQGRATIVETLNPMRKPAAPAAPAPSASEPQRQP